jgi:hypothetical protein
MSSRDDLINGLTEHACCFSEQDAKRMADAFAHELAERLRDERPQYNPDWHCWGAAADLIDPTKDTPQ